MFWYVHRAFRVPGTVPFVYRTKPMFKGCCASDALATDAPAENERNPVSNAAAKRDFSIEHSRVIYLNLMAVRTERAAHAIECRRSPGYDSRRSPRGAHFCA